MKKILLILALIITPIFSYAEDLTKEDVARHVLELKEDKEFIKLLETEGFKIISVAEYEQNSIANKFNAPNASLDDIVSLSKTLNIKHWIHLKKLLASNGFHLSSQELRQLKYDSDKACRKHHSKVRDPLALLQCQFRVTASSAKFSKDQSNCTQEIEATQSDPSEGEVNRLLYECLKNEGWKNPNDFMSNIHL